MELLDPLKPERARNYPAPPVGNLKELQEALTRIAGRRLCGCPILRFVWGQTRLAFQRGKMRLLYVDTRFPARERERHTLKRLLRIEKVREPVCTNVATGEIHVLELEKPHYDIQYFSKLEDVPRVIEPGWFYEQEPPELEWIGEQLFWIEQWKPSALILGGEAQWERNRWEIWFDPEIGKEVLCDTVGPFPKEGRYETIGVVGEKYLYPVFYEEEVFKIDHMRSCDNRYLTDPKQKEFCRCPAVSEGFVKRKTVGEHFRYKEPSWETVEEVQRAFQAREARSNLTPMQAGARRFREYQDAVERRQNAIKENRRLGFRDEQWKFKSPKRGPLGVEGGGARVYVPNQVSKPVPSRPNRHERRANEAMERGKAA